MPIDPNQWLALARRLSQGANADEADLRRSISTAYYSVFHMLTAEVTTRFVTPPSFQVKLARSLKHTSLKDICKKCSDSGKIRNRQVGSEIVKIANCFLLLHESREDADYDGGKAIIATEAATALQAAEDAFAARIIAQSDPLWETFLQELLLHSVKSRG